MNLEKDEDISAYYRGLLIQKTIDLELRMDIVIGRFLSTNEQDRVRDIIEIFDIVKIDFSQKVKILSYIIKKHFPGFLKEKHTLSENRDKFFKDINFIMENRNILAHRRHDFDNSEFLKLTWSKTTESSINIAEHNLTIDFVTEFGDRCANCFITLMDLDIKISDALHK